MKRFKILLFVCLVTLLMVVSTMLFSVSAQNVTGPAIVGSVTQGSGNTVTVTFKIQNNPGIAYLELTPSFPSALGSPNEVKNGGLISDFIQGAQYVWVNDTNVNTNGVLVSFTYNISSSTPFGEYPVSFIIRSVLNEQETQIKSSFSVVAAKIVVSCSHNHTTQYPAQASTCLQAGHAAYTYCSDCKKVISGSNAALPLSGHQYAEIVDNAYLKSAATCTAKAVYYKSCSVCHDVSTATFSAGSTLAHTYNQSIVSSAYLKSGATCTSPALYYKSCVCGAKSNDTFTNGEKLAHTYNRQNTGSAYVHTPATCTAQGTYYYSCSCGAKGTETFVGGAYASHTYNQKVVSEAYYNAPATCLAGETYFYSCVCGQKGYTTFEVGNYAAHVYSAWIAEVPATCTYAGTLGHYSCSVCRKNFDTNYKEMADVTIAKKPHVYNNEVVAASYLKNAATCTSSAVYYKSCVCGATLTDTFEHGEPLPHTYDRKVTTTDYLNTHANCTLAATYFYSCVCGAKGTETFAYGELSSHYLDQKVTSSDYFNSAATCLAKATYYYSCVCGLKGSTTFETGDYADHAYGMWVNEVPATCTASGVKGYSTCSVCQKMFDADHAEITDLIIEQLPHTYDRKVTSAKYIKSAATCTSPAIYYKSCVCGAKSDATFTYGEKKPHVFNQKVTTTEYLKNTATCVVKETYYYACVCGLKGETTFTVGELADHSYGTWINEVPATCTAPGTMGHYTCSVCQKYFDEDHTKLVDLVIAQLPHSYGREVADAVFLQREATCTAKAMFYYSCICGVTCTDTFASGDKMPHTFDQQVTDTVYVKSAATCTAKAAYYYSCVCGEKGTDVFEAGEMLSHSYSREVADAAFLHSAATCTAKASYFYSCVCGATSTDTFVSGDKLSHVYDQQTTTVAYLKDEATCTVKNIYYYSCVCGEKGTETFEAGEMLPHSYKREYVDAAYLQRPATCTANAAYYYSCICGAMSTDTFAAGDKLSHVYDQQNVTAVYLKSEATCTAKASYYYACTCGDKGTETYEFGEILTHTYGAWQPNGDTHARSCICGDTQTEVHTFDIGTITRQAEQGRNGEKTFTCTICGAAKIEEFELVDAGSADEKTGVTVEADTNVIPAGTVVVVEKENTADIAQITAQIKSNIADTIVEEIGTIGEVLDVYDISLDYEGAAIQPDGSILVTLPAPAIEMEPGTSLLVIYIADDGTITPMYTVTNEDGTVSFITNHFSCYAIVTVRADNAVETIVLPKQTVILAGGAAGGVILILLIAVIILAASKKRKSH